MLLKNVHRTTFQKLETGLCKFTCNTKLRNWLLSKKILTNNNQSDLSAATSKKYQLVTALDWQKEEEEAGDEVKAWEAWKEIEIVREKQLQQLYHRVTISRYANIFSIIGCCCITSNIFHMHIFHLTFVQKP